MKTASGDHSVRRRGLTSENATGGTVKTRGRWVTLQAQAATATGVVEWPLRWFSGRLGYREWRGPPAVAFALIAVLWQAPTWVGDAWSRPSCSPSAIETSSCRAYVADHDLAGGSVVGPAMVDEILGYGAHQHLGRVMLAPAAPLKAFIGASIGRAPAGMWLPAQAGAQRDA